jgi:DNA-binding GntR family transcriptional regulator
MGGQAKMWMMNADHHPSLLDAVVRRDATDAERFLKGHIRRLRIEVSDHPAAFGGSP